MLPDLMFKHNAKLATGSNCITQARHSGMVGGLLFALILEPNRIIESTKHLVAVVAEARPELPCRDISFLTLSR